MQTNRVSIAAAVISTIVLSLAILSATWLTQPVQIVLALPLLFFWPGHLSLRILGANLPPIENALVAVVMSIAICLIGCFVLYGFSALTPIGWALWMLFVVGVLSLWILVCGIPGGYTIQWPTMRRWHICTLAVAVVILSSAYVLAIHDELTILEFSYTEFWMVSPRPGKLVVGVKNMDAQSQIYDLSVTSREGTIAEFHSIPLNVGETWTRAVESRHRTEATLYLHTDHGRVVYRHVTAAGAEPEASDAEK